MNKKKRSDYKPLIVFIIVFLGNLYIGRDSKLGVLLNLAFIPAFIYLIYGFIKIKPKDKSKK